MMTCSADVIGGAGESCSECYPLLIEALSYSKGGQASEKRVCSISETSRQQLESGKRDRDDYDGGGKHSETSDEETEP